MKLSISQAAVERFNNGKFEKYIQYFAEYKIGRATFRPAFSSLKELKLWAKKNNHTISK